MLRPLTGNMWFVLALIVDGEGAWARCNGASQHGGRHCTLQALYMRGLTDLENNATDVGREAIRSRRESMKLVNIIGGDK